jgi:hypothetical protein
MRHSVSLVRSIAGLTVDGTRMVGRESLQRWRSRRRARLDALDRLNRIPLPSLYADFPEARNHLRREVGLRSIPLDAIAGTAVAGPAQRGSDFTPMPAFRSQNWEARWHRLSRATNDLTILPPIDVVQFGDRYWIEDGHNRVAAALRNGQMEIDAAVTDLRSIAATTSPRATATLAPMLEEGRELRAAGEGRFSAQAASLMASTADDAEQGRGHAHDDGPDEDHGSESAAGTGTAATDDPAPKARRRISRMPRRRDETAAASAAAAATEETAGEAVDEKPPPKRRRGKVPEAAAEPGAQPMPSSGAARDADPGPADPDDAAAPAASAPETTPAPEAP